MASYLQVDNISKSYGDRTLFENISFIMARYADPSLPDKPEEWLDRFETFSIYQVLPEILKLWGLNVETDAESKKKADPQPTGS